MGKISTWVIGGSAFLGYAGLYLAFAANVGVREVRRRALTAWPVPRRPPRAGVRPRPAHVAVPLPLARDLAAGVADAGVCAVAGTGQVLQGLWKQLFDPRTGHPSVLAAVPFDVGDPADLAARPAGGRWPSPTPRPRPTSSSSALVEDQRLLLYHQIIPGDVIRMAQQLGARP